MATKNICIYPFHRALTVAPASCAGIYEPSAEDDTRQNPVIGDLAYVTDGQFSTACLAVYDGTNWNILESRHLALAHLEKSFSKNFPGVLTSAFASQPLFIAKNAITITQIDIVAETDEDGAADVTLDFERLQAVEDLGGGDVLLTAPVNLKTGIVDNTVLTCTLTATGANLALAAGNRIAMKVAGTEPTELADLCITVTYKETVAPAITAIDGSAET